MQTFSQDGQRKQSNHCIQAYELIHSYSPSEAILALGSASLNDTKRLSVCYCTICSPFLQPQAEDIYTAIANMSTVDIGPFADELYCLKRDFALSNLPPEECIKTVRKANSNIELKVVQINLFDMDGEVTILELWNDNAILGVRHLWQLLGKKQEILLQFKNLSNASGTKKKRLPYKRVEPNTFMKDMYSFPVKARIIAEAASLGMNADLPKHCVHIDIAEHVQLLCDDLPVRHYSMWHKTVEEQQEDDDPTDLQRLIMSAGALNVLQKRNQPEETTKPDNGYVPIKQEPNEEQDQDASKNSDNKKARTESPNNGTNKMEEG